MRLAGRVAFVTGSSRGIGAAIALKLAADGARLVLHARGDPARAQAVARQIRDQGGVADVVLGDLTDGETAARVVRDAFAVHGALDILVCNAGGGEPGLAVDKSVAAIDRILALNLRAVILSTIEFARLTQSPHGRVVLISSGSATHPAYGATIYAAAKAGAEAFVRSVAQELGERGITLNTVAPGTTRTEMIEGHTWPEKIPKWAALKRIGEPEDIADIVAFLASDEARWLTGVTLAANGGLITTAANILAHDR
ncbi:SDR family oxidoreductase [Phenylobacterium sp. LjRoot219]|uniref:SDR family NAD(P)-dependent oxidoreductase n=1 Tax=Phenylobacterium sp. LjRoot219 TaxID=3342283 RepID=UPI003ECF088C